MDFVIENYLWFIIGAIVLLMIIIGYFAEKTNFGKLPLKPNKEKEEKNNVEEIISTEVEAQPEMNQPLEQMGIADVLAPTEITPVSEEITEPLETPAMMEEDLNVPFGDVKVEDETPIQPVNDLPDVPEFDLEQPKEEVMSDESEDDVWKF